MICFAKIVKGERKTKFENFVFHLPLPNRIPSSRSKDRHNAAILFVPLTYFRILHSLSAGNPLRKGHPAMNIEYILHYGGIVHEHGRIGQKCPNEIVVFKCIIKQINAGIPKHD